MEAVPVLPEQCEAVADALVRAFADDPVNSYIFKEREGRMRKMRWIFRRWLPIIIARHSAYTTPDCAGAALWCAPGQEGVVTHWEMIRAGFLRAAFLLNPAEQMRGLRVHLDIAARTNRLVTTPHWVLDTLGVAPEFHRKGVARAMLQPVLRRADADAVPCFVITHNSVNVPIYERFGFTLIEQDVIARTNNPVYCLRRTPQHHQPPTATSPAPATD